MAILVALDGVLRSDANTPIREGRILYDALVADGRIILMCEQEKEKVEYWLGQYGIKGYAGILSPSVQLTDDDPIKDRQIAVARALGRVDLVIDSDPVVIEHCLDLDIPALLFAHPKTMLPAYRPDGDRRTWDQITQALARQREKEAAS